MNHAPTIDPLIADCRSLIESLFYALELSAHATYRLLSPSGETLLPAGLERIPVQDWSQPGDEVGPFWLPLDEPYVLWSDGASAEALRATAAALNQMFLRYREQQLHVATLSSLYEIATTLGETIQLDDLLERILAFAQSMVKASSGSLVMLDEVNSELKMLQQNRAGGMQLTTTKVSAGEDLQAWLRQEGQLRRTIAGALTPAVLGIPLKSRQRVVGSLTLIGQTESGDFSERDVQALGILAGHAANAIRNAQLYLQVERQVSELQALHQLSESLNRTITLEQVLQQLLDDTLHLLEAESASVMLLDPEEQTLSIKMARGLSPEVIANTRVRLGERISGKVAETRKPILYSAFQAEEAGSALSVPLLKEDQVLGVLNARHKKGGGDFTEDELSLAARFANVAALSISNAGLHKELRQLFVHSIEALANAVDARDPYTSGHSRRVTQFSVLMAERLGFSHEDLEDLRYASLLHDIGKIRIRDHILHKPGKLTDEEFEEMKQHPQYGVDIMRPVRAFHKILPYMLHHHERYDGRGYPAGLSGSTIPQQARIMCVADCFDAMTSDRPYRKGMPVAAAESELRKYRGSQFDPEIVDLFLDLIQAGIVAEIVEPGPQPG